MAVPGDERGRAPGRDVDVCQLLVGQRREEGLHPLDLGGFEPGGDVAVLLVLLLDGVAKGVDAHGLHLDLDARLVDVVAPAAAVVHAQNRLEVGEQLGLRHPVADDLADDGRTTEAAADEHLETDLASGVLLQVQADVVHLGRGAIMRRARHRNLELARQVGELGMQGGPLANDLAVGARVFQLIGSHAGVLVRRDVADAVAAGLDGMHLDRGEMLEHVRHVFELRPVELQVLPRGEVAEIAIVGAREEGELAQLSRGEQAVRNRDAQHGREALDVETVA